MPITERLIDDVTILAVSGRLTIGEAVSELENRIKDVLASGGRKILLNLADVAYMDSSGIGQLVGSMKGADAAGGKLKLLKVNARVEGLLRLTRVYLFFESFDDEKSAIQSFD